MHKRSLAGFFCSATGALIVLALVAGFVPDVSSPEIRRPYTENVIRAGETSTVTRPLSHIVWNIRGSLDNHKIFPLYRTPVSIRGLLQVQDGMVTLKTTSGIEPLLAEPGGSFLQPILESITENILAKPQEKGSPKNTHTVSLGEPLDFHGVPLRWADNHLSCGISPETQARVEKILNGWKEVSGLSRSLKERVYRYKRAVETYALKYKLDPGLIFAIIYTESSFNPTLISSQSAHGLMQVVPHTAGEEVHVWLGLRGIPNAENLLHPETNIRYGTAYFHLLLTRHLKDIKDPLSREYCAIASYNSGPWGMLKTFGKTNAEAFVAINNMSSDEVRDHLLKRAPSRETRSFFRKVLASKARFTAAL